MTPNLAWTSKHAAPGLLMVLARMATAASFGGLLMTAGVRANECDATQSQDICQPFVLEVAASPLDGGVIVRWEMSDDPPPNAVLVYRQPAGTDGPLPGSKPLITCQHCGVGNVIDKTAQPGVQYWYWVCATWDNNGQVCAPHWAAGLIATPAPPPAPLYPRNLKIKESATWATSTHWMRRWNWSWDAGNQRDYAFVVRQISTPQGWMVIGSNLLGYAAAFGEDLGVRNRPSGTYRVCAASFHAGGGPFDIKTCSNSAVYTAAPVPVPKAPLHGSAAAFSRSKIDIQFASGDDDVSAWFDAQRLNGPGNSWLTLKPRVNFGSPGVVVDDGSGATTGIDHPFTYRVCAGNETGTTCSDHFEAKVADVEVVQQFRLVGLAGKCLNAQFDGLQVPNGAPVTLYTCMNGFDGRPLPDQLFSLGRTSAHPIFGSGGKCLDVTGADPRSGTPLELWDCHGGANQSWTFAADGTVRGLAGKCLDVAGGGQADGTRLILWDCTGATNQRWRIENVPP
jgi:hypothetical protein